MKKYVQYIPTKDGKSFRKIEHSKPLSSFQLKIRRLRSAVLDMNLKSVNEMPASERLNLLRECGFSNSQFKSNI